MSVTSPCLSRAILAGALALWLAVLPGCTTTHVAPQAIDSPLPQPGVLQSPCACLQTAGRLAEKESCYAIVQSENKFSDIGLGVRKGERYLISVPGTQFWFDKDRRVPAPQGDVGSSITRHLSFLKRHTESKWFALMATSSKTSGQAQDVGQDPVFAVPENGPLMLYPNDASFTYGNNQGRIMVVIERCESRAACGR